MRRTGLLAVWILSVLPAAVSFAQPVATGMVVEPEGRPVAAARVELLPVLSSFEEGRRLLDGLGKPAPAAVTATDEAGRFAVRAPEPGLWTVVVQSAGRLPVRSAPLPLVDPVELPPAVLVADAGAPLRLLDAAGNRWPVPGWWRPVPGKGRGLEAGGWIRAPGARTLRARSISRGRRARRWR